MAFPKVQINQLSGGSGRPLPGFDYYSGMIFYGTAPSVTNKWATYTGTPTIKAQQLFSAADATSAGILPYTENTSPTSTHTLVRGGTGDTINIFATLPKQNVTTEVVDFGIYTQVAGDSTNTLLGDSVAAFINASTTIHGFSATAALGVVTITAPKSVGKSLNSGTVYTKTIVGTMTDTIVQNVVAGTASQYAIWYYQISEYFRVFGTGGTLWVGIISATSSRLELVTLQNQAALGKLRQIGMYDNSATTGLAANITASILAVDIAAEILTQTAPCEIVYSPNIYAVSDLSTYTDQNLNVANTVQCVISQDGLASGALLAVQNQQTVGNVGVKLATIAKSRVSASDAQPIADFNVSDGTENNTPAFGNGLLSSSVSAGIQLQLQNYNYTFFVNWGDVVVGTYWNDNRTCIVNSDSYAYVNDNRVFHKVSRICRQTYVPLLNSEIIFNADGTLTNASIETFQDAGVDSITAGMITGFGVLPLIGAVSVTIDPTQNVKATNNLSIFVTITENGIARTITLNIGLV